MKQTLLATSLCLLFLFHLSPTVYAQPTWTVQTPGATANNNRWRDVTYGGGKFVAVSNSNLAEEDMVMTSTDGTTWESQTSIPRNVWYAVAHGDDKFVAVGIGNNTTTNIVMTSSDGITWAPKTLSTEAEQYHWKNIVYGNGIFVAIADNNDANSAIDSQQGIMTSSDGGDTWVLRDEPAAASGNHWEGLVYGNGLFVATAVSATGSTGVENRVMTSPDGMTWTSQNTPHPFEVNWTSVTYGNGIFVAVNSSSTATHGTMTSPDGITWTLGAPKDNPTANYAWRSITFGGGLFKAVAAFSDVAGETMYSSDGINWTNQSSEHAQNWWSITYANGLFVAVANSGSNADKIMTCGAFALPIELTYFKGQATPTNNLLLWQTATETENKGFEVQRSKDGKNWDILDFIPGNYTTQNTQNYTYVDKQPLEKLHYYRLKQMDLQGEFEYSEIIMVHRKESDHLMHIFPNPVKDELTIKEGIGVLTIYDMLGKPVRQLNNYQANFTIDVEDLSDGIYILQIQQIDGRVLTHQFVK